MPGFLADAKTWLAVCRKPAAPAGVPATLPTTPQALEEQASAEDDRDSERTEE